MREFRVKKVTRYILTDWEDFRGSGSVREIGEFPNVDLANETATVWGEKFPGSLVNHMEPEPKDMSAFYFTSAAMARADAILAKAGITGGVLGLQQEAYQDDAPSRWPNWWDERELTKLPYELVAMLRRAARETGDQDVIGMLDRQRVAVDA